MKKIILILFMCLFLLGCSKERTVKEIEYSSAPSYFVKISSENGGDIIYDTRTGVQYWRSIGSYNYGTLTMLVGADGNPLLYK